MEQQLINALMKLLSKAGGGSLVKDLIQQVDQNGNPKVWTPTEVEAAVRYINWQTENFGTAESIIIIQNLMKKYNLKVDDFQTFMNANDGPEKDALPDAPGIHGLN